MGVAELPTPARTSSTISRRGESAQTGSVAAASPVRSAAWQRQPPKSISRRGQLAHGSCIQDLPRKALAGVACTGIVSLTRKSTSSSTGSRSALVSSTPSIGLPRTALGRGCSGGKSSICVRRSGGALTRNHLSPSALSATLDCVRPGLRPARVAGQLARAQFHCARPPPAAVPRSRTQMPFLLSGFPKPHHHIAPA